MAIDFSTAFGAKPVAATKPKVVAPSGAIDFSTAFGGKSTGVALSQPVTPPTPAPPKVINIPQQTSIFQNIGNAFNSAKNAVGNVIKTVLDVRKNVGNAVKDTVVDVGKGLVEQYTNPSTEIKQAEATVGNVGLKGSVINNVSQAFNKVLLRTFGPVEAPVAHIIADVYLSKEISDKVASGVLPSQSLDVLDSLRKTNLQVFGDVAQAVLGAYMPGIAESIIAKAPVAGIVKSVAQGGVAGSIFGGAQVLSSGSTNPAEIAKTIAGNTLAGAGLSGIFHGVGQLKRIAEKVDDPAIKQQIDTLKTQMVEHANQPLALDKTSAPTDQVIINKQAQEKSAQVFRGETPASTAETPVATDQAIINRQAQEKAAQVFRGETPATTTDPLTSEAKKYESAEEFVKAYESKMQGFDPFEYKQSGTPKEQQVLHDAFIEYAQKPGVQKIYTQGGNDTSVLTDIWNKAHEGKIAAPSTPNWSTNQKAHEILGHTEFKPVVSENLTPTEAKMELESQHYINDNYAMLRDQYLSNPKMAVRDTNGDITHITINTDEARSLLNTKDNPDVYTGTNAKVGHEAASLLTNALYKEALPLMAGKGNNTILTLGGGGGSGKGSAVGQFADGIPTYDMRSYPIVLDQVFGNFEKGLAKLKSARDTYGYDGRVVFVDRNPTSAFNEGVKSRALNLYRKGELPRTVALIRALKDNIMDRAATLKALKEQTDFPVSVIDNNHAQDQAVLIEDRKTAIKYLERQTHDEKAIEANLYQKLKDQYRAADEKTFPSKVAEGLGLKSEDLRGSESSPPIEPPAKSKPSPKNSELISRVSERLNEQHPDIVEKVGYGRMTIKDEIAKSVDLIEKDPQAAYQEAMGATDAPEHAQVITNITLAEKALADGNNALYAQLVKQRSLAQTGRGQAIVAEKASVTDNSVTRYVKELIKQRLDNLGTRTMKFNDKIFRKSKSENGMKAIKEQVEKAKTTLSSKELDLAEAQKIIDSLACA